MSIISSVLNVLSIILNKNVKVEINFNSALILPDINLNLNCCKVKIIEIV